MMRDKKEIDAETAELSDDLDILTEDTDDDEKESVSYYYDSGFDDVFETDASDGIEENKEKIIVESEDILDDFDTAEDVGEGFGKYKFFTADPDMIELRAVEYHNSGYRCLLATMSLGISLEAPVLTKFPEWEDIVMERLKSYFCDDYIPHTERSDLFLPAKYEAYFAVEEADKIYRGKPSDKEIAKYLMDHKGAVIIDVGDAYKNFRAKSWLVKLWFIDTSNYKLLMGGNRFEQHEAVKKSDSSSPDPYRDIAVKTSDSDFPDPYRAVRQISEDQKSDG